MTNALITGWGMYAPSRIMSNHDLENLVDTSDEWIVSRTGIRERRIAADDETTTTLSVHAARDALAVAGMAPEELDLVILGTCSPDYYMPATAVLVAHELGATRAAGFDLMAACSGFVFSLATATAYVRSGMYRNILVTGGLLGMDMYSDGSGKEGIIFPAGGSACPTTPKTVAEGGHFVHMAGKEVYRYATRQLAESARAALRDAGLTVGDVDQFLFHQANLRIIESVQNAVGIPPEKTYLNIEKYGNTSAASVPMALVEAVAAGRIQPGDRLLMVAFGAGYTAGAAVVEWTADPQRAFLAPGAQTRMDKPMRELAEVGA
jgi:3-oxoacyl-[acyl-carrier-protein] synthase-3